MSIEELKDIFWEINDRMDNHKNIHDIQNGRRIFLLSKKVEKILNEKMRVFNDTTSMALKEQMVKETNFISENIKLIAEKSLKLKKQGLIL